MDTYAELYDSQGNLLVEDDDGGDEFNFRITKSMQAGEQVLLNTRLLETSNSGRYYVHIEEQTSIEE